LFYTPPSVLDEHTRECLAIEVGRWMRSQDCHPDLSRLMKLYGKPEFIRSDNYGAEFTAKAEMKWLRDQNVGPAYIAPGEPVRNSVCEVGLNVRSSHSDGGESIREQDRELR
jgi:hypothetical protein